MELLLKEGAQSLPRRNLQMAFVSVLIGLLKMWSERQRLRDGGLFQARKGLPCRQCLCLCPGLSLGLALTHSLALTLTLTLSLTLALALSLTLTVTLISALNPHPK